jgi:hypothetical protein
LPVQARLSLARRHQSRSRLVVVLLALVVSSACVANPVGPVSTFEAYREKASSSIGDAISAVGTVGVAATAEINGSSYTAFSTQVADDSLDGIRTAQDTFEAIVPPDAESEALQPQVLDALADSRRGVTDVLTALQVGDRDRLAASAAALEGLGGRLDELQQSLEGSP